MVQDIRSMLKELSEEIALETQQKMSPEDKKLHAVAQKFLVLERDLKAPGAARSSDERADRILEALGKENF